MLPYFKRRILNKENVKGVKVFDLIEYWPDFERNRCIKRGYWCDSYGNTVVTLFSNAPDDFDFAIKEQGYEGPDDWEPCRIVQSVSDDGDEEFVLLITNPDYVYLTDDEAEWALSKLKVEETEGAPFEITVKAVYHALMKYKHDGKLDKPTCPPAIKRFED